MNTVVPYTIAKKIWAIPIAFIQAGIAEVQNLPFLFEGGDQNANTYRTRHGKPSQDKTR